MGRCLANMKVGSSDGSQKQNDDLLEDGSNDLDSISVVYGDHFHK
jgi:hypothetical protein